ncbi:MAG: radical SAM protein [Clostridia bacterium]|nr:radical SAM protein [Clostridia bacterium]
MQVGKILFPITTLGPGKRLGIWVQGCNRFCKGCSNPELQIFDESKNVSPDKILEATLNLEFDGVTISGGEPFLQIQDLKALVELYNDAGYEDILIYTGFTLKELTERNDEDINYILSHIAVLIDGAFDINLVDNVPLRGSSNQNVWILNSRYKNKYEVLMTKDKTVDIFCFEDDIHFIGIPFDGYDKLYRKLLTIRRGK